MKKNIIGKVGSLLLSVNSMFDKVE